MLDISQTDDFVNLEEAADAYFKDNPDYKTSLRVTHTYFSRNPLYLGWKIHKRKIQNHRSGLSPEEVAILKISLDDSKLRRGLNKHDLVFGSIEDLDLKLMDVGIEYKGFIRMMYGKS